MAAERSAPPVIAPMRRGAASVLPKKVVRVSMLAKSLSGQGRVGEVKVFETRGARGVFDGVL